MVLNNEMLRLAVIVTAALALIWFINKMNGGDDILDTMEDSGNASNGTGNGNGNGTGREKPVISGGFDGVSGNELNQARFDMAHELGADDLLPGNENTGGAGHSEIEGKNFLFAGHHIGINTVGQSLRNANQDIRSEPPNPQVQVSPWIQSTIGPDMLRRPLEIGASY